MYAYLFFLSFFNYPITISAPFIQIYLSYFFRLRMNMKKTGVKKRTRKINLRFVLTFLCLFFTVYWFFINQVRYQPNLIFSYHSFKNIKFFQEMALEPHLQEINSTKSVEDRWLLYLCTLCIYVLYVSMYSMYLCTLCIFVLYVSSTLCIYVFRVPSMMNVKV